MKVLVISDTHGRHENLKGVVKREKPFDLAIHLGDAEGYEADIAKEVACPLEIVAGNCDFFSSLSQEKEIAVGKYKIFLSHGHYYNVNAEIQDIQREAMGRGCDIVMFGHTHRPLLSKKKGIITVNPGSLSFPRQDGRCPSYAVMELDALGEARIEIRYLT